MTRDEYLQVLRDNLTTMSDDERDDVIRYYLEYFIDAGAGREQAVMEELGNPEALADRLCGTDNYRSRMNSAGKDGYAGGAGYSSDSEWAGERTYYNEEPEAKRSNIGKIIVLVCTFPFWLPIVFALIAIIGALILSVFAIFGAFVFAGVVSCIFGFVALFKSLADGLLVIGTGLIVLGLGIFAFFLGGVIVAGLRKLIAAVGNIRSRA